MNVAIESRRSLEVIAQYPFADDTAVISITDSDRPDVELAHSPKKIIRLKFDDVSDEIYEEVLGRKPSVREMKTIAESFKMFTDAQAQQIADFVFSVYNSTNTFICQCEYGQSRSAAVAAALMEYYYQRGIAVFSDARYYPNKFVYRKLLASLQMRGRKICP